MKNSYDPLIDPRTKEDYAKAINALPGPKVTSRPKKSILVEIYQERLEEQAMEALRQHEADYGPVVFDECDDCNCDPCECGTPVPTDDELGSTGRIAIVAAVVIGLAGILYLVS